MDKYRCILKQKYVDFSRRFLWEMKRTDPLKNQNSVEGELFCLEELFGTHENTKQGNEALLSEVVQRRALLGRSSQ